MKKEFVIRGQTASSATEKLSFSGHKKGYAYKLTEFSLYPSDNISGANHELSGSITAGKVPADPVAPNFKDEGLIATTTTSNSASSQRGYNLSIVNDTFMITQDLILKVENVGGTSTAINWQCRFESVKMSKPEEAVVNYKQFLISDD